MSVCRLARDPNGKRSFAFGCPHTYIVNGRRNGPRTEEAGARRGSKSTKDNVIGASLSRLARAGMGPCCL